MTRTFSSVSTPSISLSSCGTMVFSTSEETPGAAGAEQRVHLVEEHDDRGALAGLLAGPLEHQPDVPLGLADVLVEQLGALDVEEVATSPPGRSWPRPSWPASSRPPWRSASCRSRAGRRAARPSAASARAPRTARGAGRAARPRRGSSRSGRTGRRCRRSRCPGPPRGPAPRPRTSAPSRRRSRTRPSSSRESPARSLRSRSGSAMRTTRSSSALAITRTRSPSARTSLSITTSPTFSKSSAATTLRASLSMTSWPRCSSSRSTEGLTLTRSLRPPVKTSMESSSLRARKVPKPAGGCASRSTSSLSVMIWSRASRSVWASRSFCEVTAARDRWVSASRCSSARECIGLSASRRRSSADLVLEEAELAPAAPRACALRTGPDHSLMLACLTPPHLRNRGCFSSPTLPVARRPNRLDPDVCRNRDLPETLPERAPATGGPRRYAGMSPARRAQPSKTPRPPRREAGRAGPGVVHAVRARGRGGASSPGGARPAPSGGRSPGSRCGRSSCGRDGRRAPRRASRGPASPRAAAR